MYRPFGMGVAFGTRGGMDGQQCFDVFHGGVGMDGVVKGRVVLMSVECVS